MIDVLPFDLQLNIGSFLSISDVCAMRNVDTVRSKLFCDNDIWRGLYQSQFPLYEVGPKSVHNKKNTDCQVSTCVNVNHYLYLTIKKFGLREYGSFRKQYMKRIMTIDKRMIRSYAHLSVDVLGKRHRELEKQIHEKQKQINCLQRQQNRLKRARYLKSVGLANLYMCVLPKAVTVVTC
jgi:hypothetical protein